MGRQRNLIISEYFKKLYNGPRSVLTVENNGIFDYRIDVIRGIEWWAVNKASGIDNIPGEFYKNAIMKAEIINRLQQHFKKYTYNMTVPDYFMKAKLILISKDGTEYPEIDKIRPISILPTITKIFELSILKFLEETTLRPMFWNDQRGFLKGRSTLNNINDVLQTFWDLQKERV